MATELEKLDVQIKDLQEKRKSILDGQRSDKLKEAKALIAQFGFTASDLGLSAGKKKAADKTKAEAKYANPKDASQTWSGGKGRKPLWVTQHLAAGGNIAELEIKK